MSRLIVIASVALLALASVAEAAPARPPEPTHEELLAMQQQRFQADRNLVFLSVLDGLRDLGYQIVEADPAHFTVKAASASRGANTGLDTFLYGNVRGATHITATVTTGGRGVSVVRLEMVTTRTRQDLWSGRPVSSDANVTQARAYQIAFEKINQALFTRRAQGPAAGPLYASGQ